MAERSSYRIPMRLSIRYAENGTSYNGIIKDMSESGMFVLAEQIDHSENSMIKVELPVNNNRLHLTGKLIRIDELNLNKKGFGISIIEPPQEYIDYIEELLRIL